MRPSSTSRGGAHRQPVVRSARLVYTRFKLQELFLLRTGILCV